VEIWKKLLLPSLTKRKRHPFSWKTNGKREAIMEMKIIKIQIYIILLKGGTYNGSY
jgi:hypothetical protein